MRASRVFALTVVVGSVAAAAVQMSACGNEDFSSPLTDAAADAPVVDAPSTSDGPSTSDSGDGGVTDGAGEASLLDDAGCPTRGGAMLRPPGLPSFCIDRTEVTQGAYDEFVAANVAAASQDPMCQWNTSFLRQVGAGTCPAPQVTGPSYPINCVDFCDAVAFCRWAGKQLCGAMDGGFAGPGFEQNPQIDPWYAACSARGARIYPYGATYDAGACNGKQFKDGGGPLLEAGSLASCQGGFEGLYDMSGNVFEWERRCDPDAGGDAGPKCAVRSGSNAELAGQLTCGFIDFFPMTAISDRFGFRCCAP